jgi:hypothetical protein
MYAPDGTILIETNTVHFNSHLSLLIETSLFLRFFNVPQRENEAITIIPADINRLPKLNWRGGCRNLIDRCD